MRELENCEHSARLQHSSQLAQSRLIVREIAKAERDGDQIEAVAPCRQIVRCQQPGVDPFDQPAVEEGKILARKYLEGG